MFQNKISGNLCMDMCVDKTLTLPDCSHFKLQESSIYNASFKMVKTFHLLKHLFAFYLKVLQRQSNRIHIYLQQAKSKIKWNRFRDIRHSICRPIDWQNKSKYFFILF